MPVVQYCNDRLHEPPIVAHAHATTWCVVTMAESFPASVSRPATVTVLCCVAEHRRPVYFTPKEGQTHLKCLVEAVKSVFSDVISSNSKAKYGRESLSILGKPGYNL